MNYYTEIMTRLKTACSDAEVMTAAGISGTEWTDYHVFDTGRHFIAGQNRGRVPFVNIWRTGSDYTFDAVDSSTARSGTLESTWNIEVVVGKSSRTNERTNETQAYDIAQKVIKSIRKDFNMRIGTESIGEIQTHPFGLSLSVEVNIQNTHNDSEK